MNENPILEEIWRIREEIARESNYEPHAMAEAARLREVRLAAEGWKLVSFAGEPAPQETASSARRRRGHENDEDQDL